MMWRGVRREGGNKRRRNLDDCKNLWTSLSSKLACSPPINSRDLDEIGHQPYQ